MSKATPLWTHLAFPLRLIKSDRYWLKIEGWPCVMSFQSHIMFVDSMSLWHLWRQSLHELILASLSGTQNLIGTDRRHCEKVWVHCLPVELFNKELKLVSEPVWLSTEENKQHKTHSSAVIAFATQEEAQKALKTRIIVAGMSVRTAEYTDNKPYDQCQKCQGFEHTYQKCTNKTRCQICAGNHHTRTHTCHICKNEQEECGHTMLKMCKLQRSTQSKQCRMWDLQVFKTTFIKCRVTGNEWEMSTTTYSTSNIDQTNTHQHKSTLKIFQHNCNKVTSTMHSVLESAVGKVDIVLFQEPWIGPQNITVSHSAFTSIIPATELRSRVVAFIAKANCNLKCTSRSDISTDSDLQALSISMPNLKKFLLLNIYNEKSLKEDSSEYTVERALSQIKSTQRTLLCEDLNAHHSWWNSKITQARNAEKLIK